MNILKLLPETLEEVVGRVVPILKAGGVVVVPTDTVYGLAADYANPRAIKRVFKIKKRPLEKEIPIFVPDILSLQKLSEVPDEKVRNFLERVWPGKVTCVLKSREGIPELRGTRDGTIALRIPNHEFVLKLLRAFGEPLTGTSANISGNHPHVKIQDLVEEFETAEMKPDLIVDAGDLPESLSSTVVDLTSWPPKIIREGAISKEELQKIINML